jgi:hypothetical protein
VKTPLKAALITLATGVPAFFLTPVLFPLNPNIPPPDARFIPYFIAIGIVESLFFGLGVAFLALGLPLMRRVARVSGVSPWPSYLAIGYLTASWWPHLGMHAVAGMDADKLLLVDYGFHLPYILSAGVVAYFFVATLRAAADNAQPRPAAAPAPGARQTPLAA